MSFWAPIVTYFMTLFAGTGHTAFSTLPVIVEGPDAPGWADIGPDAQPHDGVRDAEQIERLQEVIARELGFRLVDHRLELYGVPLKDDER